MFVSKRKLEDLEEVRRTDLPEWIRNAQYVADESHRSNDQKVAKLQALQYLLIYHKEVALTVHKANGETVYKGHLVQRGGSVYKVYKTDAYIH